MPSTRRPIRIQTDSDTLGFRLSNIDIIFMCIIVTITCVCIYMSFPLSISIMPLFTTLIFFAFCNICRIGNTLEIIWVIVSLPYMLYCILFDISTIYMYTPPLFIAIVLIVCSMSMGWYRGFMWDDIARMFGHSVKKVRDGVTRKEIYRNLDWISFLIDNKMLP